MKIFLYIVLTIVGWFAVIFLAGFIKAALPTTNKKRRAYAVAFISTLPASQVKPLLDIFVAYKKQEVNDANQVIVENGTNVVLPLVDALSPENRPALLSGGRTADITAWTMWMNLLTDKGYTENAAKLIAGIFIHELDPVLNKMRKKAGLV